MKIRELTDYLESIAPLRYQESYDNAGLIVGDASAELKGALICLDSTEAVIEEAVAKGCNLVVAHHPIVFRGLKRITGRHYVERVVIKAIKNDVAIYAIHTNLDNVYRHGVNARIAEKIALVNTRLLAPKQEQRKLLMSVPSQQAPAVCGALAGKGAAVTELGEVRRHDNGAGWLSRIEVIFPGGEQGDLLRILREVTGGDLPDFQLSNIDNDSASVGSGMVGDLPQPMPGKDFLRHLQQSMQLSCIRYTRLLDRPVKKVAVCGGAGGFLLERAVAEGADVFVTADFKYHEFFDADGRIVIADIGHFESEQFTVDLLYELISRKFTNFAAHCTEVTTNPVNYWC